MTANPGDEELRAYLSGQGGVVLERPGWLEVEERAAVAPVDDMERRIRELTAEGLSMRAVQQQVFGYVGGKAYDAVKPIYEEVKALQGGITEG